MTKLNCYAIMIGSILLAMPACGDDDDTNSTDSGTTDAATDSGTSGSVDAGIDADAGTDADTDSGAPGSTTVTPASGGSAEVPLDGNDEASVDVPSGAVSQETPIRVAAANPATLPTVDGEDVEVVSEPVAFTPHGTAFTTPVTIAFTIDGGVPAGASIVRLDDESDTSWELISSTINGDVISAQVSQFSIYTVATGSVCDQSDPDSDGDGICDSSDPCAAPSDDTDGNGVCDDAEARITGTVTLAGSSTALADTTVTLYDDLQNLEGTTTTDANGNYSFGNLTADSYTAVVSDSENCRFGSAMATVALGEIATIDIAAGCF